MVRAVRALGAVECVRSQIDQVFLNLLANAAQAIPGPGHDHASRRGGGRRRAVVAHRATPGPAFRAGRARPHLRSVLHHQAGRRGHRPRAVDQLRDRQEARRRDPGREPAGRRRGLHDPPADERGRGADAPSDAPPSCSSTTSRACSTRSRRCSRMEHRVLRADRPDAALDLLAGEDVAVVVSDQRMPGMTRHRAAGPQPRGRARHGAHPPHRLHRSRRADGVDQRGRHLPLPPEAVGRRRSCATLVRPRGRAPSPAPRARAAARATWRRKNAELEQAPGAACAPPRADLVREASVRTQLQRYVSPRLVDLAIAEPRARCALPGDWREATVLFADIRGFTRLIESTPGAGGDPAPRRVLRRDDRRDLPPPGHGGAAHRRRDRRAVRGARAGPGRRGAGGAGRRSTWWPRSGASPRGWAADGLPTFDIGVGISSGPVMAGTIGSERRRELIVVGRAMIAAARIQRMTRLFDAHIIVERGDVSAGGSTRAAIASSARRASRASGSARRSTRFSASGSRRSRPRAARDDPAPGEPVDETTVLIVDDEPRVLDALEAILAAEFRVLRAGHGEEALARLAAEPDVAVIVTDHRMPGHDRRRAAAPEPGADARTRCASCSPPTPTWTA